MSKQLEQDAEIESLKCRISELEYSLSKYETLMPFYEKVAHKISAIKIPHKCLDDKFVAVDDTLCSGATDVAYEAEHDDFIDGSCLYHYGDVVKFLASCVNSVRYCKTQLKKMGEYGYFGKGKED